MAILYVQYTIMTLYHQSTTDSETPRLAGKYCGYKIEYPGIVVVFPTRPCLST